MVNFLPRREDNMDSLSIYNKLKKYIPEERILINESMKNHTSMRVGGPADIMVLPNNIEEIKNTILLCNNDKIPFYVLGNGTNIIVRDKGIRGVVIKLAQNFNKIDINENLMKCQSGALLSTVAKVALEKGLSGMEFAGGIPGTIGGAAVMNAGAYDGEMSKIVEKVVLIDMKGNISEMSKEQLQYSYRYCVLQQEEKILLEVYLRLTPDNPEDIKSKMNKYATLRKQKQPLNLPSAGSTFKRPPGNYAGYLIEQAGLKGYRVGGAMVSDLHAGFIVNVNNATCEDIINLIQYIKQEVKRKFNVELEPEVKIEGEA